MKKWKLWKHVARLHRSVTWRIVHMKKSPNNEAQFKYRGRCWLSEKILDTLRVLFLDFLSSVRHAISQPLVDKFVRNLVHIRFNPFYEALENTTQDDPPGAGIWHAWRNLRSLKEHPICIFGFSVDYSCQTHIIKSFDSLLDRRIYVLWPRTAVRGVPGLNRD